MATSYGNHSRRTGDDGCEKEKNKLDEQRDSASIDVESGQCYNDHNEYTCYAGGDVSKESRMRAPPIFDAPCVLHLAS